MCSRFLKTFHKRFKSDKMNAKDVQLRLMLERIKMRTMLLFDQEEIFYIGPRE